MSFLTEYDELYAPRLTHRDKSFRAVFSKLLSLKPNDICIIETGAINEPGNWSGHGQSTILFDHLTQCVGGEVFCIDTSLEALITARRLVSNTVNLVHGDSVRFLNSFKKPIDLLYLDSLDFTPDNPLPAAKHQLFELCAAMRNLHSGSIILVDDTWWHEGVLVGKGVLTNQYMNAIHAEKITDDTGLQVAWLLK